MVEVVVQAGSAQSGDGPRDQVLIQPGKGKKARLHVDAHEIKIFSRDGREVATIRTDGGLSTGHVTAGAPTSDRVVEWDGIETTSRAPTGEGV